jgi:hypothetical protein
MLERARMIAAGEVEPLSRQQRALDLRDGLHPDRAFREPDADSLGTRCS